MRCSYGTCRREARYSQWWDGGGGLVCATDDTALGVANLMDGFGLSRPEAAALNREMDGEWRAEVRVARYGTGVA